MYVNTRAIENYKHLMREGGRTNYSHRVRSGNTGRYKDDEIPTSVGPLARIRRLELNSVSRVEPTVTYDPKLSPSHLVSCSWKEQSLWHRR